MARLVVEQTEWDPPVGHWRRYSLQFFRNWKKAPEDSAYHHIGERIYDLAEGFEPCDDADIEAQFGDERGNIFGDILLQQRLVCDWDGFSNFQIDSVECRVRVTPAFSKWLKRQARQRQST
jgi:hypothetical protein